LNLQNGSSPSRRKNRGFGRGLLIEGDAMKNLQEATEQICDLKGSLVALDALVTAMIHVLPHNVRADLLRTFESHAEVARTVLLHTEISEHSITAFERDVQRTSALIGLGSPDVSITERTASIHP
jgi:hypothetical protein